MQPATLYWDLSETVAEVKLFHPRLVQSVPHFHDLVADLAAMSLRDMSMGTHNCLDDFIDQNLGSEFHYLALFFRRHTQPTYQEITQFADRSIGNFDWFEIDDITQLSPLLLKISLNVGYYHGDPKLCMATIA